MFETTAKGSTWSRTSFGRGKRLEPVTTGCYVIEHICTGKLFTGVSASVSNDVDLHLLTIGDGTTRLKKFVKLCVNDSDLKLYEYPTTSLKAAKKLEQEIRASVSPTYLLMN